MSIPINTQPVRIEAVDRTAAEIKRMYVRDDARGLGAGRDLLDRLLVDARHELWPPSERTREHCDPLEQRPEQKAIMR